MDASDLSEILLALYRGALEPDEWLRFQQLLSPQLNTINSVLSLRWPTGERQGLLYVFNSSPRPLTPEQQRYLAIDPFVNIPEGRAIRLDDLVDGDELRRSQYYRELLVPIDVEYALGLDLSEPGRFHARLRLCRSASAGTFSDADCRVVDLLAPHLRVALTLYSDLGEARSARAFYADAMDQLTMATIILDEDGRVMHKNRLAELVLQQRDGISLANGALTLANREEAKRLRELIDEAVKARLSGRPSILQVMRVRRRSGRPDLGLVIRPSSPGTHDVDDRSKAAVAVFIGVDAPDARTVSAEVVQKLFGLTPKEASLAVRLGAGRTLHESADDLGISLNTARAHLRAIYAKTGFERQTELVRALLQSVAMLA